MSRRWPPPSYEMVNEEGTGKSKKLAKRQAAHKMWLKLQELPTSSSVTPGLEDDDDVSFKENYSYEI
ncbi:hypothetical protein C0J52_14905 [Blattella germanica]|nr:hypothetical protein C0J52_14905 [Blattella germanica]